MQLVVMQAITRCHSVLLFGILISTGRPTKFGFYLSLIIHLPFELKRKYFEFLLNVTFEQHSFLHF